MRHSADLHLHLFNKLLRDSAAWWNAETCWQWSDCNGRIEALWQHRVGGQEGCLEGWKVWTLPVCRVSPKSQGILILIPLPWDQEGSTGRVAFSDSVQKPPYCREQAGTPKDKKNTPSLENITFFKSIIFGYLGVRKVYDLGTPTPIIKADT